MKVRDIIRDCGQWMPSRDYDTATPAVSVLLPTFRRAKSGLFEQAVQSVLDQDLKSLELIIIDDASTDGTAELIAHFMRTDPRISCIRHRYNVGLPAISEYEGYRKARGEYIAFIFDDNVWERDYLSKTINFMVRSGAKATYGRVRSFYKGDTEQYNIYGDSKCGYSAHSLPYHNHVANGGVVLSRDVIESVGLYDPHVTMARMCDWSLWKRIARKYEFVATGVLAGVEKEVTQSGSLENSHKMSCWAMVEREAQSNDAMFLPDCFEDIEINMIAECSSRLYCDAVNAFFNGHHTKKWFKRESVQSSGCHPLRVLVLATSYDASLSLSFLRLPKHSCEIVLKFGTLNVPLYEVAQADAVILVRNVIALDKFKIICKELNIPCYLYVDDNFIELANDNKKDHLLKQMKEMLRAERLKQFDGIFTSTEPLQTYFAQLYTGIPIIYLPPCAGEFGDRSVWTEDTPHVLSYMGGSFRDYTFINVVMPALAGLANQYSLKLLYPSRINLDAYRKIKNLELVPIEFDLSLDVALMRYAKHRPQFLLHCGPEIKNNQYKTENALINATQMGAVLVASDVLPFARQDGDTCICVKNTIEAWRDKLNILIEDENTQHRIYQNALAHCAERYDAGIAFAALKGALSDLRPADYFTLLERSEAVIHDLLYVGALNAAGINAADVRAPKPLGQVPLSYTGGLQGKRRYQICCQSDTFSELGICFASYGDPHGKIKVGINSLKCPLRECVLDMQDFVRDNWTYLEFAPIENPRDQIFEIVLEFEYENISAQMGVFEDATKRTFIYRLLNKLGVQMKVQDLLFVDCR